MVTCFDLSQTEHEEEQARLLGEVERAQNALWCAEGSRASSRVRANREDALHQAEENYDRFMGEEA